MGSKPLPERLAENPNKWLFWGILLGALFGYYTFLLTAGGQIKLWEQTQGLNLTFNSMLEHLLRGRFDVDPDTVAYEGFYRDGRTYAYWGILPAIFRLPLLLIPNGLSLNVTPLSCLVAVCVAVSAKLSTLRQVFGKDHGPVKFLVMLLGLALAFSGAQITFLRTTLYQEVCLWAGALAAVFIYYAVRCTVRNYFDRASLCRMAVFAGLALLTRVSMAVGLYAALFLLIAVLALRGSGKSIRSQDGNMTSRGYNVCFRAISSYDLLPPLIILLIFAAIAATINYFRWGHPLVFADYNLYLMNKLYSDRLLSTQAYGLFNPMRLPLGVLYYFFPILVVRSSDGHFLFENQQKLLLDAAELPPSSFLLTDALLVALLGVACWVLAARRPPPFANRLELAAIGGGLSVAWLVILSAIYMSFRFRIEFYPLLEFGAFIAVAWVQRAKLSLPAGWKALLVASVGLSIGSSHLVLILYRLSPPGPATALLGQGVVHFYASQILERAPSLKWLIPPVF